MNSIKYKMVNCRPAVFLIYLGNLSMKKSYKDEGFHINFVFIRRLKIQ